MINFKTSGDFFVVETPKQGGGNIETTYPRQYFALKVGADMFQILNIDTKARLYLTNIADVTIDGVVFSNNDLFITELNKVLYSNSTATTSTPTIATKIPMINENGVLVWQNTMSDGTITYTLQDGTAYAGDVTLLLPYSAGTHKVADFSITTFAVSGAFDYLKTKAEHGFSLIQSIEIGEGQTFNAFTNYNILPNGDLVISTNSVFPNTNFVRITGIQ